MFSSGDVWKYWLLTTEWCRKAVAILRGGWHLPPGVGREISDLYGWEILIITNIYIYIYILLYVYFVFIKKGSYQILYTVLQSRYIHSTGTHALWLFMGKNWMEKCLLRMELVKEEAAWVQLQDWMGQWRTRLPPPPMPIISNFDFAKKILPGWPESSPAGLGTGSP